MAEYRYLLGNFGLASGDNEIICELPLYNVTWTDTLNAPGSFTGSLLLDDEHATADFIKPGARTLYVLRDGKIEWGGILWRARSGAIDESRVVELQCEGFWSWMRRVVLTVDKTYLCQPHMVVAWDLARQAIQFDNCFGYCGNTDDWLYVHAGSGFAFGDATYTKIYRADELNNIGQLIEDLAARNGIWGDTAYSNQDSGFDFEITSEFWEPATNNMTISHQLRWGFPRKGQVKDVTLRTSPDMMAFDYTIDAAATANGVYVAGSGTGDGRPTAAARNSETKSDGSRYLSTAFTAGDTDNAWVLQILAQASLNALSGAIVNPEITIRVNENNENFLMSLETGDTIKVSVNDQMMQTTGEGQPFRIQEMQYVLEDGGDLSIAFKFFTQADRARAGDPG